MTPWYEFNMPILQRVSNILALTHHGASLSQLGFRLEENLTVHGIGSEMLRSTCLEAVYWGNSFWFLSRLVTPDPQTGKLQQDGLIFKVNSTKLNKNDAVNRRADLNTGMNFNFKI